MTRPSSRTQLAPAPRRRTVLHAASWTMGALALGGASACSPGRVGDPTPDAAQTDPDVALLERVSTATRRLADDTKAAAGRAGSERGRDSLTALSACLIAHLDQFAPEGSPEAPEAPEAPDSSSSPGSPDRRVRAAAAAHVTLLTDAAGQAESGAFARLLACAAAGLSQHLSDPKPDSEATSEETP